MTKLPIQHLVCIAISEKGYNFYRYNNYSTIRMEVDIASPLMA